MKVAFWFLNKGVEDMILDPAEHDLDRHTVVEIEDLATPGKEWPVTILEEDARGVSWEGRGELSVHDDGNIVMDTAGGQAPAWFGGVRSWNGPLAFLEAGGVRIPNPPESLIRLQKVADKALVRREIAATEAKISRLQEQLAQLRATEDQLG